MTSFDYPQQITSAEKPPKINRPGHLLSVTPTFPQVICVWLSNRLGLDSRVRRLGVQQICAVVKGRKFTTVFFRNRLKLA